MRGGSPGPVPSGAPDIGEDVPRLIHAPYSRAALRSLIRCSISRSRAVACASRRSPSGPPCLRARSLTSSSRARCSSSCAITSLTSLRHPIVPLSYRVVGHSPPDIPRCTKRAEAPSLRPRPRIGMLAKGEGRSPAGRVRKGTVSLDKMKRFGRVASRPAPL
jgi:hypothetical protein